MAVARLCLSFVARRSLDLEVSPERPGSGSGRNTPATSVGDIEMTEKFHSVESGGIARDFAALVARRSRQRDARAIVPRSSR
jgi:hypothetical protein